MSEEAFVTLVRDNSRLFKPLEDLHSRLESFFNRMLRVNRALLTLPEPSELEAYFSVEDGAVKRWNGPSIDSNDTIGVEGGYSIHLCTCIDTEAWLQDFAKARGPFRRSEYHLEV